MVRVVGLEPTLLAERDFESRASTSFTTPALTAPLAQPAPDSPAFREQKASASRIGMATIDQVLEDYAFLDADDRYRLLIDLGRELEAMPDALKTDATKVRGCSASVWVYPTVDQGRLHFLADSNAAITKGVVALVLSAVQDKPASEIVLLDVAASLAPFELSKHLSANRTQGVPNMIMLVK